MSGDEELDDMLGPDPVPEPETEILVDSAPISPPISPPTSRPMGANARGVLERSRSYPVQQAAKRNTPVNLQRLLSYVEEMPVGTDAARRIGISYSTLKYWLQKSKEGRPGDGFDVVMPGADDETGEGENGNTMRFHIAWDDAMRTGMGRLETVMMQRATGYAEPLTYQGRVQYRIDPEKAALARMLGDPEDTPDCYLLDQYGAPVPETLWKMDPDLAMFLAKTRLPEYNPKAQMDVNIKGGVLVVGMKVEAPEDLNLMEAEYRRLGAPPVTFDDEDDGDNTE